MTVNDAHKRVCPWRHAYLFDNPLRRLAHNRRKLFSPYLKPGMTAADIGCGMGFSAIGMAKIVGPGGRVIAADLQPEMLNVTMKRAKRAGVDGIIHPHQCRADSIGIEDELDFAVTFWVVHEVPDAKRFLAELQSILKPGGYYMLIEPAHHVPEETIRLYVETAEKTGMKLIDQPKVRFSKAAVFANE
ncbi:MAG TPA: class I SAM-dependent methyltransferase [Bacteroidetes bacterium]|nr:class I SAM-dependent methyltransferase [Bacteroidota bacterium]